MFSERIINSEHKAVNIIYLFQYNNNNPFEQISVTRFQFQQQESKEFQTDKPTSIIINIQRNAHKFIIQSKGMEHETHE